MANTNSNEDVVRDDLFEYRSQVNAEDCAMRCMYQEAFSADGKKVLTTSDNEVILWDLCHDDVLQVKEMDKVRNAFFMANSSIVIVEHFDKISAYNANNMMQIWILPSFTLAHPMHSSNDIVAVNGHTMRAGFIDSMSGRIVNEVDLSALEFDATIVQEENDCLLIEASLSKLAIAKRFDLVVTIWDIRSKTEARSPIIMAEDHPIDSVSICDTHIAIVSTSNLLSIYSTNKPGKASWSKESVFSARFSPNGRQIFLSHDCGVEIWSVAAGVCSHPLMTVNSEDNDEDRPGIMTIMASAFSNDGLLVAGADDDTARIHLWDAEFGTLLGSLHEASDAIVSLAFSKCGSRVGAITEGQSAIIWDLNNGHRERLLTLCQEKDHPTSKFAQHIKSFLF